MFQSLLYILPPNFASLSLSLSLSLFQFAPQFHENYFAACFDSGSLQVRTTSNILYRT